MGKIRVLVVDDFAEARTSVNKLLQFEEDIEMVGGAEDGPTALQLAREIQPDIILMDINMPGMDGIRATEAIVESVPLAQVIMMSVQGETDYLRRAMLAGAYSSRLVLPRKIAPAARSLAIMVASCGGLSLAYAAAAPAVVRISMVS